MLRYVAFLWDPHDLPSAEEARQLAHCYELNGWRKTLDSPGVALVTRVPEASLQLFQCSAGFLLGTLFPNPERCSFGTVPLPLRLTPDLTLRIIETRGRELIDRYWGNYIALFQELARPTTHIVRGPTADIDCLAARLDRLLVYASDVESLSLCRLSLSIDWFSLARSLLGPDFPGRTHLQEIRQLAPGCRDEITDGRTQTFTVWRPAQFAKHGFEGSRDDAARSLRTITRACVQARASEFPAIVVGLSGGLDSSITLASLSNAPTNPRVISLTQFAEGDDSDERHFARLSADRARCELVEYRRCDNVDLQTAIHGRVSAICPGLRIPSVDRIEPDFAIRMQAQAIFRGHGGDELFNRNRPSLYLQDRLRSQPWTRECLSLAAHAAFMEGDTIWRVLFRALRERFSPARWNLRALLAGDVMGSLLLRNEVITELAKDPDPFPLMGDITGLPKGKLWQLSLLCARRNFTSPFDRDDDPEPVSPLLSQPILELCLRIPSWYQVHGHRDRALARDAFRDDLDPRIAGRTSKGGGEMLALSILERNRPFLREMLFEGHLASSRIIDLTRLRASLSDAPSDQAVTSAPLFDLLGAEIWARALDRYSGSQNRDRNEMPNARRSFSPYRFAK